MNCINHQALARRHQRGGAALVVTLIIFIVATLIAAFANRNLVFEQRASANQYRSTQAFEAAEAGLEWATAMLNNPRPINDQCVEGAGASVSSRERYLSTDPDSGALQPVTWSDAGHITALRAVCVKAGDDWTCACPRTATPSLSDASAAMSPSFAVQFSPDPQAGAVRLVATGCTGLAGECLPGNGKSADATGHVQLSLGAIPAIATLPVAALTARDSVNAAGTSIGIHNPDALTGGVTVQAGRSVVAPNARLTTAPGGSSEASVIENDASLAALDADHLFVSFFGIDKALWRQQPGVKSLRCDGACTDSVVAAVGAGHRMIWIDGDAELSGPIAIGKRDRPVVIVASGALRLIGPVSLHGVVYAGSVAWQGAAGGQLRGAAISESSFTADAAADLVHDAVVLTSLKNGAGSFARIPGSWRDF